MSKEKKEKDLSMTDEAWNKRTGRITAFLEHEGNQDFLKSSEDIQDAVDLINMNIRRGNRKADTRKNLWNQILIEGREWTVEKGAAVAMDWPVGIGAESKLPAHVQESLKTMIGDYEAACVAFWESNPIVQTLAIYSDRNKERGGQPLPDAETFGKNRALAMKQRYTKFFNEGRWDGNYSSEDGLTISLPPVEESPAASETESEGDSNEESN